MPENDYDSSRILCRRCLERDVSAQELRAYLDGYVRELPEAIRADVFIYRSRLARCEDCPRRAGFTCTLCGCYVQARAAKRVQRCPQGCW